MRSCGKTGHIAKAWQIANKKQTTVNKKSENKRTRKIDTVYMVTYTTTESDNDDVPLLATQSLVNKTDCQRMKCCQSLSIPIQ